MDARTVGNRIAADLRRRITTGALLPGDALPSERELGEQYEASRGTIRRALGLLVNEGLVTSRTGLGHFVRVEDQVRFSNGRAECGISAEDMWSSWVTKLGRNGSAIVAVAFDVPPLHVVQAFDIPTDGKAVVRSRIQLVDGDPWMRSNSYFPLAIAVGTPLAQVGDATFDQLALLRELGHEPVRYVDEIRGRMPSPDETKELGLDAGVPIVETTRMGQDRGGVTICATVNVFPANRFIVVYDLEVEA